MTLRLDLKASPSESAETAPPFMRSLGELRRSTLRLYTLIMRGREKSLCPSG
jgi:hypothetical protein